MFTRTETATAANDVTTVAAPHKKRKHNKKSVSHKSRKKPSHLRKGIPATEELDDSLFETDETDVLSFVDEEVVSLEEFEELSGNIQPQQTLSDEIQKITERLNTNLESEKTKTSGKRPKVQRRRQIDPTTCERDYTSEEVEFMNALNDYKRSSGRMFPTCSEVLEVLKNLGYAKTEQ
ncbi:MAG: hypothetical protein LBU65_10165 [Planctomycetaceae bacterium]|nr:hypothetical protein [Planctomycetaceae bacterium]